MRTLKEFLAGIKSASHMSATTETISFTNKNGKKFTYLLGDLNNALRAIWIYGKNINASLNGNWEYEEGKFRQAFNEALAHDQNNNVASQLGSQTPNTIRCLEIYAFYLLGKEPTPELYKPDVLKEENLSPLFYSSDLEESFAQWLISEKRLAERSSVSYSRALSGVVSDAAGKKLNRIDDIELVRRLGAMAASNESFIAQDLSGNQMYSGALKHYIDFVASLNVTPMHDLFSSGLLAQFESSLTTAGFNFGSRGASGFIFSAITKPFVIFTGNSGTGKTRLATLFTTWLYQKDSSTVAVIPVGSDWTDNRNVLGFVNHLRPAPDGLRLYESTPILELILRAAKDVSRPYFLILDEMNLSHVERYFSDFLSAMESGRPIPLHTSSTSLKSPQGTDVPANLTLPDNLFITGTVNVDETTYMFSPKVLDRANVIEFRVTKDDAGAFLAAGAGGLAEIAAAPASAAQAFLALSRKARKKPVSDLVFHSDDALKSKRKALSEALTELFGIMYKHRMEFGYRTMHEVLRYAGVDYELAADRATWSWAACLDVQILQKILPKLHGSKKRVEQLLVDLAVFCETGAAPAGTGAFTARSTGKITYPQSYEKLACMIEAVRRDQFVSFI